MRSQWGRYNLPRFHGSFTNLIQLGFFNRGSHSAIVTTPSWPSDHGIIWDPGIMDNPQNFTPMFHSVSEKSRVGNPWSNPWWNPTFPHFSMVKSHFSMVKNPKFLVFHRCLASPPGRCSGLVPSPRPRWQRLAELLSHAENSLGGFTMEKYRGLWWWFTLW